MFKKYILLPAPIFIVTMILKTQTITQVQCNLSKRNKIVVTTDFDYPSQTGGIHKGTYCQESKILEKTIMKKLF